MKNRSVQSDNWATPKDVYEELNGEFNFDFDPCPLNYKVDGLTIEWGQSNFINPPYSRKLKESFIRKAFEESKKGKLCIMLLPVSTSTKIFHNIILPYGKIRFWKGRIKFLFNGLENEKYKFGQTDNMIVIFKPLSTSYLQLVLTKNLPVVKYD
jgi:site-specific DNA-methyltransferase (adenine-specific)